MHALARARKSGTSRIGALRGVPAGMGRARRRLERGEKRFPRQRITSGFRGKSESDDATLPFQKGVRPDFKC
jgi:hypothetical protein